VTDGGIAVALSSQHLFPNLVVLGPKTTIVNFADSLMPRGSLLTVGITTTKEGQEKNRYILVGYVFTLPFYGKPVKAVGEIDGKHTVDELHRTA
jgi:hypothetical protein